MQFLQNHLTEMESKKTKEITWSTVRYMVAEIQYGGRITDDKDIRTAEILIDGLYREEMLQDGFAFSSSGTRVRTISAC